MGRRILRLPLGVAVALALVGALVFGPSASATQPECQVVNLPPKKTIYTSNEYADPLGTAIAEAEAGDTLQVIGTCVGHFYIWKDLTLTGRVSKTHDDVLDGGGDGRVLGIGGGGFFSPTVEIAHLTIRNGNGAGGSGGGIHVEESSTLKLTDSIVTGNKARWGGGIDVSGDLLVKDSVITGNEAEYYGGGIHSAWGGSIDLVNSTVTENSAGAGGAGIAVLRNSSMRATDSLISTNHVGGALGLANGGGVYSYLGWVTVSNTDVNGNSAGFGGGVFNHGGVVFLYQDSRVRNNTAAGDGGGIFNSNWGGGGGITGGIVGMSHSRVVANTAGGSGGGIYNEHNGEADLIDSTVTDNVAAVEGGGIYWTDGATVTLTGSASVSGNTAPTGPDIYPPLP